MSNKTLNIIGAVGIIAVLILFSLVYDGRLQDSGKLYRSFKSPDARYSLEVYVSHAGISFPGKSGDYPGRVILKDQNGNTLRETKVEMVNMVHAPGWEPHRVSQKLIFDWGFGKNEPTSQQ